MGNQLSSINCCNQCKKEEKNGEIKFKGKKENNDLIGEKTDNSFLSNNYTSKSNINASKTGISVFNTEKENSYISESIKLISMNIMAKKIQKMYRNKNKSFSLKNNVKRSKRSLANNKPNEMEVVYYNKNKSSDKGFGIQIWQDNAKYVGMYEHDKANGIGIFYHSDGDIYQGEFLMDRAEGYAIYNYLNGAKYEGYWKNDVQCGIGIENWKDKSYFEGTYSNGKKNGIGKYTWADGSYYEGEWKDNNIDGYGIYNFADERVYKGDWKNNMMNGFGLFNLGVDKVYFGFFVNDLKDGFGIYKWISNDEVKIYLGFWSNGKQNGLGKYYSKKGNKLGNWVEGERNKWYKDQNEIEILLNNTQYKQFFSMSGNDVLQLLKI